MDGITAKDARLIPCIWSEKLIFCSCHSISRNIAAKNSAEVDGLPSNLLVLFKWHFLRENYWVANFSSGLHIASSLMTYYCLNG